jgi:mono/diheme cytochrome c family protein
VSRFVYEEAESVNKRLSIARAAFGMAIALFAGALGAQDAQLPPFPKELLENPEQIAQGKEVFGKICKFCHGKSAYPGKAPKLNPSRYTPEFVFDRVTNGFRGMPAMKEQFSEKERQAVTVFVMSKQFSN